MVKSAEVVMTKEILNQINGTESRAAAGSFIKVSPHNGELLYRVPRSAAGEVAQAVAAAQKAQPEWGLMPAVRRGEKLAVLVGLLRENRQEMARIVAQETGKSPKTALAETDGVIALGSFFAGEGQRLYGRTTTSGVDNRQVAMVRQPRGVAGLIIAANTPAANAAWKIFPALICGNAVVLKAAEDAPATAWFFGELANRAGLAPGLLNIVQGLGPEAGAALAEHPGVDVISFTGSTEIGRKIALAAAARHGRVSLELGGKNALVVCDDADLDAAVAWTLLSAFSNTGQRCAAASRVLVFDKVYETFRSKLIEKTAKLRVGPSDDDDLGPLINEKQMQKVLAILERAKQGGAKILTGGGRLTDPARAAGYYVAPAVVEDVQPQDEISTVEIFGPVAALYRVRGLQEALTLANDSAYGLTSAIHTRSLDRAHWFAQRVRAGIVSINGGTFGSEPHLPFGGFKASGNGTREPGTEALDVYSELKNIYLNIDPSKI